MPCVRMSSQQISRHQAQGFLVGPALLSLLRACTRFVSLQILGWVRRKFRREAAAGDPHREVRLDDDGGYPCPQPSPDELCTCFRLNHPRPFVHRPSFPNDGGCRGNSLPDEQRPHSMDDHVLPHGLLAIGTLRLDPSGLEGCPPPHLCFSIIFLAQKKQSEAAEENNMEPKEAPLPETGYKNGSANFSPRDLSAPQKVEAAGGRGRENQGEKKVRTLTGVVKKVLKWQGTKAGGSGRGGRENQDKKKERTLTGGVKKALKRRGSKAGAVTSNGGPAATLPASGCREGTPTEESKLYKLLKIFHKKVHPKGSIARKKHKSPRFNTPVAAANSGDGGGGDDEAIGISTRATRKEGDLCHFRRWTYALESASLESSSCRGDSNGSREHWIKTDRDYLVLEL